MGFALANRMSESDSVPVLRSQQALNTLAHSLATIPLAHEQLWASLAEETESYMKESPFILAKAILDQPTVSQPPNMRELCQDLQN